MTADVRVGVITYSLAEVAAAYLPAEWADGERWLRRHLNRGEISGYRVGRTWRMTEDDVAHFIDSRRNTTIEAPTRQAPPVAIIDGLSQRSRQSLRVSA